MPSSLTKSLLIPGRTYHAWDPIISTTVFHWFTPTEGNMCGHWPPQEGRENWTGEKDWWIGQIKLIMVAKIDLIYVHLIETFEQQRIHLFQALYELRSQGYDVPKVVPFLDPMGIWQANQKTVDVGTTKGKDEFVSHYIRFYKQYFEANPDPHAESYLARIDGRLALATWWVYTILVQQDKLTRKDIETRLQDAFGAKYSAFANGIWMITTALIDPDLTFSDERHVMFSGYSYCLQSVHNGIHAYHIQGGYWDQNLRRPGYIMPRLGGKPFRGAWDYVLHQCAPVHRIYVESWNEYDESSGIYPANPGPPVRFRDDIEQSDVWSDTNDSMEYIRAVAAGASEFSRYKPHDARILYQDIPAALPPGQSTVATVVIQNYGNQAWILPSTIGLYKKTLSALTFDRDAYLLEHAQNEVHPAEGVFRGAPLYIRMELTAPLQPGKYTSTWVMMSEGILEFGEELSITIDVR